MQYTVISYTPSVQKPLPGQAIIRVNGCVLTTAIDVPYGCVQLDAKWNLTVDPVVASVLDAMDPNSLNYDPTLLP